MGGMFMSDVVTADFNGDGNVDIAVNSCLSPCAILVYLGNGDGTFRGPVTTAWQNLGAGGPLSVADVNRDGKPDLVFVPILFSATSCFSETATAHSARS
jgi:FG-GAP-like repeat